LLLTRIALVRCPTAPIMCKPLESYGCFFVFFFFFSSSEHGEIAKRHRAPGPSRAEGPRSREQIRVTSRLPPRSLSPRRTRARPGLRRGPANAFRGLLPRRESGRRWTKTMARYSRLTVDCRWHSREGSEYVRVVGNGRRGGPGDGRGRRAPCRSQTASADRGSRPRSSSTSRPDRPPPCGRTGPGR